jgi:hypothetical protein
VTTPHGKKYVFLDDNSKAIDADLLATFDAARSRWERKFNAKIEVLRVDGSGRL